MLCKSCLSFRLLFTKSAAAHQLWGRQWWGQHGGEQVRETRGPALGTSSVGMELPGLSLDKSASKSLNL